jgi:hypothetical protein
MDELAEGNVQQRALVLVVLKLGVLQSQSYSVYRTENCPNSNCI